MYLISVEKQTSSALSDYMSLFISVYKDGNMAIEREAFNMFL